MVELKTILYIPLLFFGPRKLVDATVEDTLQRNRVTEKDTPERRQEFAVWHKQQVDEIRSLIARSFLWVAVTFVLAWLPTLYFGDELALYVNHLQAISAFMILWSIFGKAGWSVQSLEGDTLPEKVNESWFRTLTWLGIYLMVLSLIV